MNRVSHVLLGLALLGLSIRLWWRAMFYRPFRPATLPPWRDLDLGAGAWSPTPVPLAVKTVRWRVDRANRRG